MDFKIVLEDGDTRDIDIPDKMPYRLGKKIRRKIRSRAVMRGGETIHEIDNPVALVADMTDLIVEEIVPQEFREFISEESADSLLELYYEQIQGKGAKKKSRGFVTSSATEQKQETPKLKKPSK